jgi:hypothetical protein
VTISAWQGGLATIRKGKSSASWQANLTDFFSRRFEVEWLMAGIVFLAIGAQNVYSSYVISFIMFTGATATSKGSALLSTFWAATVVARVAAISTQMRITTRSLFSATLGLALFASLSALPLYFVATQVGPQWGREGYEGLLRLTQGLSMSVQWPDSNVALWFSTILYGAAIGPVLGYLFDVQNRVSSEPEKGSAVLIFGMNAGTSIVPWLFVALWDIGAGSLAFPIVLSIMPILAIVMLVTLYRRTKETKADLLDLTNDDIAARKTAPEDGPGEEEGLMKKEEVEGVEKEFAAVGKRPRYLPQIVMVGYFVLVTAFYLLSSAYPQLYAVQLPGDCNTPGELCLNPALGNEASVLAFYLFLYALGVWGVLRIHSLQFRRWSEKLIGFPLLGIYTSVRELTLVAATLGLTIWWFVYWYDEVRALR